jgi:predicted SnoaL-like aldol condensation-catalyzing enzyme
MEHRSNKTIVIEFYKQVIGQHDFSLIDTFISDTYIQHSPMAKDGKAGIMEMLQMLKNLPKPAQTVTPLTMAIADGDIVALQLDINIMGKRALVVNWLNTGMWVNSFRRRL